MFKSSVLLKRALLGAFFIFNSCSPCSAWQYDCITSCDPCFQSARVYYEPQNVFREPGVEIAYNTDAGFTFYLNLYGCPLPQSLTKEGLAEVVAVINSEPSLILACVCLGNQRIMLPEEAAQRIIQSLLNHDEVCLKVGHYRVTLPFDSFDQKYNKMVQLL